MTPTSVSGMVWPAALERLVSLQAAEVRLELINTYRRISKFANTFGAPERRRVVDFDTRIYRALENDRRLMFAESSHSESDSLMRDVATLHNVAGKAFLDLLVEQPADSAISESGVASPQLLHLALHHYCESIKWGLYRHEPVKSNVWQHLHRVYSLIEAAECATVPSTVYSGVTSPETMQARFVRTLLLDLLNTHNLSAAQTEIGDTWLEQWCTQYEFDRAFSADKHRLFVDLDAGAGLQLMTDLSAGDSSRFLGMPGISVQLADLHESLRSGKLYGGKRVEHFAIEEHFLLADIFSHLHSTMFAPTGVAIEARTAVSDQTIDVLDGFEVICDALAGPSPAPQGGTRGPAMELTLEPVTGQHAAVPKASTAELSAWRLVDISNKGMGLQTDAAHAEGIEQGDLLLSRTNESASAGWMLLNVARKKIHRPPPGSATIGGNVSGQAFRLGAEILSRQPIAVDVKCLQPTTRLDTQTAIFDPTLADDNISAPAERSIRAVYLPGTAEDGRADSLLFAIDEIGASNIVEVTSPAGIFTLRLSRVVRKGRRWISYRFDVLSQHQ